jgi:hypothetical protein
MECESDLCVLDEAPLTNDPIQFYLCAFIIAAVAPIYLFLAPSASPKRSPHHSVNGLLRVDALGTVLWVSVVVCFEIALCFSSSV